MAETVPTVDVSADEARSAPPQPGALIVFSGDAPSCRPMLLDGDELVIGRDQVPDASVSRQHVRVARKAGGWRVADLDSRNGTFMNGKRVAGAASAPTGAIVRASHTIFLLLDDTRPFAERPITSGPGGVIGPLLHDAYTRVKRAALRSECVLITGESGCGKEAAARAFHAGGPNAAGPFVPVNCAAIPASVAERLLFGAVKGAYSGATADAEGYVAAADGGVLFLDEIGDLDVLVQAKLLRLLESHEITPVGAARPRRVSTRFCFATHRNLRESIGDPFRPDLFYRIAKDHVELPALRERRADIPWLIAWALERVPPALTAHARLVEACMLRPWPGNVRELLAALRRAADEAVQRGLSQVRVGHLDETTGAGSARPDEPARVMSAEILQRAIDESGGNLSAAARSLGLHRSQLYRLLRRFGLTPPAV